MDKARLTKTVLATVVALAIGGCGHSSHSGTGTDTGAKPSKEALEKARLAGLKAGKKQGFEAGKTKGFADGKAKGFQDGKTAGKKEGFADGKTAGIAEGKKSRDQEVADLKAKAMTDEQKEKVKKAELAEKYQKMEWQVTTLQGTEITDENHPTDSVADADKKTEIATAIQTIKDNRATMATTLSDTDIWQDVFETDGDITINGANKTAKRYNLNFSKIAQVSVDLPAYGESPSTYVLAYAGKPTELNDDITLKTLAEQNKGDLTYEGGAFMNVHFTKRRDFWGDLREVDNMSGMNGEQGKSKFTVNLEAKTIAGTIKFEKEEGATFTLENGAIKENGTTLEIGGDIKFEYAGPTSAWGTEIADKTATPKGTFKGKFMGPNAEELAGSFVVDSEKVVTAPNGDWQEFEKYGQVNGVFNAARTTNNSSAGSTEYGLVK